MDNNDKDIKYTRHISRIIHFVRNVKEFVFQKTVLCEVGLQLADIETNNVREDGFNPIFGYNMLVIDNWQNTCTREVI